MYKQKYQKYIQKIMTGGLSCPTGLDQQYVQTVINDMEYSGDYNVGFMKIDNGIRHVVTYQLDKLGNKIILGAGGLGQVYKGQVTHFKDNVMEQQPVVIKEMDIDKEYKKNMVCLELLSVFNTSHKNIIKYYGYAESNNKILLFMEYLDGKDLFDAINDNSLLISEKVIIAKQLLDGLHYLHQNNIYHRDIKPENIMITRKKNCEIIAKYIDFNFSCIDNFSCEKAVFGQGTPLYMSPELINILQNKNYSDIKTNIYHQHDLWALGATLYVLFSGELLFDDQNNIINATQNIIEQKIKTKIPYQTELEYIRTNIFNLLNINPANRIISFQRNKYIDYQSTTDIV